MKKTFDWAEQLFIIYTLKAFEFCPNFIHSVKTIFKNVESCVMSNGRSPDIPLEWGTRQGDLLYAYLCVWLKFLWGEGVVDGEGVAVKDAWSGVVGAGVIKGFFQKHLKTGGM